MPRTSTASVLQFPAALLQQAQPVRVAFFDVDGVLTDGGLHFTAEGESSKRFNTLDGHGLKLLRQAGITPAVITGRDSAPLRLRLQQLGVTEAVFGTEDKVPAAEAILARLQLTWAQAAMMGDDWPDLPVMRRCALAAAPANAHPENLALADWVSTLSGGHGAVRQLCDLLLLASGHYQQQLEHYLR